MKHLDPERIRHALHNVHNSAPGQLNPSHPSRLFREAEREYWRLEGLRIAALAAAVAREKGAA
jgi:hypothetical protein